VKESDPKGTPKTLMSLTRIQIFDGGNNLKATSKEIKQHTCGVELQSLPNIISKKNDE
jgi:hypothetical protein